MSPDRNPEIERNLDNRVKEIAGRAKASSMAVGSIYNRLNQRKDYSSLTPETLEDIESITTQNGNILANMTDMEWVETFISLKLPTEKIFEFLDKKEEIHSRNKDKGLP